MTDAFARYGDETGYRGLPKKQERLARGPSELDVKMEEKQRLSRAYKAHQRAHAKAVLQQEPRLKAFRRYLKTADDADELLDAIRTSWLPGSSQDVRLFALRLVDQRCQRIRLLMGEEPLDDPWPPETNVYFEVRAMLHSGGRA